jgi:hypothetical protein
MSIADGKDTPSGEFYIEYNFTARQIIVKALFTRYPSLAAIELSIGALDATRLALETRYCGRTMYDKDLGYDVVLTHAVVDTTSFRPLKGRGYFVVPILFGVKAYGGDAASEAFLRRCRASVAYSHKHLEIYSEEDAEATLGPPEGPKGPKRKQAEPVDGAYDRPYYRKRERHGA